MGRAIAEIETRADVPRLEGPTIPLPVPTRIAVERFRLTVDRQVIDPKLAGRIRALHDGHHSEPIEGRPVALVAGVEMTDGRLTVDRRGDRAESSIPLRIISKRPRMRSPARREPPRLVPARLRVADAGEWPRRVAPGPPTARRVFDVGIEDVAPPVDPQRDRIRGPPLVDRPGVEESDQYMDRPVSAGQYPRGGKLVGKGPGRDRLAIERRFGRGRDDAPDFSVGPPSGMPGRAEPEVLANDPGRKRCGPMVLPLPAGIRVETLGPIARPRGPGTMSGDRTGEERRPEMPTPH